MIISRYIFSLFLMRFLMILCLLLGVIFLFDTIELLRRAAKQDGVPLLTLLQMAILKLPEVAQEILVFAMLFSGMSCFWSLSRRQELTILRASGLSAWQFVLPATLAGFLIGFVWLAFINPLSTVMLNRFQIMESQYLGKQRQLVSISQNGLWLRLPSQEFDHSLLHAKTIDLDSWDFRDVVLITLASDYSPQRRIDARSARLEDGHWIFRDVVRNDFTQAVGNEKQPTQPRASEPLFLPSTKLETSLTRTQITEAFADPRVISFWSMPEYIALMERTGIKSTAMRMHFHALLAQPFFFAAIILLAASFCLQPPRFQGLARLLALGLLGGFGLFFLSQFLKAMGLTEQIPVLLAAWAPCFIMGIIGSYVLITEEDG